MITEILFGVVGALLGGIAIWFILASNKKETKPDTTSLDMQRMMAERLDKMMEQVDKRLDQNTRAMNESKSFIATRASETDRTVNRVSAGLGRVEAATAALHEVSKEIISFQHMLKNPKTRGGFGEILLGNLLAEILPADRYELQYQMPGSTEIADAIIKLQDGYIVAVDAKFPLVNYEAMTNAESDEEKEAHRRLFIRDVKKHISDIGKKYISSHGNTLDFAYMYIPLEGVYYETMVQDKKDEETNRNLAEYARAHKVIPVSPNSMVSYLYTILIGLRGMKIEEKAKEILSALGQTRQDFSKFADDYITIGKHLGNAKNKFEEGSRRLDKVRGRLDTIEQTTEIQQVQPAID